MDVAGSAAEPIITFRDVGVTLGAVAIYEGLGFDVRRGEFICILGPSGCGKSTMLRVIGGLLNIAAGNVSVDGRHPDDAWPEIAFVFQSPRLVPWRTALDNVLLGADLREGKRDPGKAKDLLKLVGLAADAGKYPSMLSGGERQRVSIARALVVDPKIVLMDEPFSALDPNTRQRMRSEMERIWQTTGKTVVFVTHDIDEALQLADRIVVLSAKPTRILDIMDVTAARPRNGADQQLDAHRKKLMDLFQSQDPTMLAEGEAQ